MSIKNILRQFDRYRRNKISAFEPMLYKLVNNKIYNNSNLTPASQVKSILIVRNNKRIGNMLFLLPFVKKMREVYPYANITLMLSAPWQGQIFEGIGIDNICYSNFSARKILVFNSEIQKLKSQVFDLLVTPYSSVEDTLIATILSAKNKIAPYHSRRNKTFTHVFKNNSPEQHSAFNTLHIIESLIAKKLNRGSHEMSFTNKELLQGTKGKEEIYSGEHPMIAFFRGARGVKKLTDERWIEIINIIRNNIPFEVNFIEILSPDIQKPLIKNGLTYQNNNMRILGSFLKNMAMFVSCDTGPLHLADAAGAKCIGIFTHTSPDIYGTIGEKSINIKNINQLGMLSYFSKMS